MIVMGATPQPDAALKILTPWWDMLTRYLTGAIMTIALTTTALQAAKDNLVCIPVVECIGGETGMVSRVPISSTVCSQVQSRLENHTAKDVMTTMVDRRQYDFVDAVCFQNVLLWYPTYFPFILVAMAAFLLMVDNIWVMYPKTSSALNHFVTLTMEGYTAVGTHTDIFRILSKSQQTKMKKDGVELQTLLDQDDEEEDVFDLSQAMKVKTLSEKIEQFKDRHGSEHTLLITVYIIQGISEIIFSLFFLVVVCYFFPQLQDSIDCKLNEVFDTEYQYFKCSRFIAPYYRAVTLIFAAALVVYLLISVYAMVWAFKNSYRQNIFSDVQVDDRIDIRGDLAFLFSLLEQYNKLYCDRLAIFLSVGFKNDLDEEIAARRLRRSIHRAAEKRDESDSSKQEQEKEEREKSST